MIINSEETIKAWKEQFEADHEAGELYLWDGTKRGRKVSTTEHPNGNLIVTYKLGKITKMSPLHRVMFGMLHDYLPTIVDFADGNNRNFVGDNLMDRKWSKGESAAAKMLAHTNIKGVVTMVPDNFVDEAGAKRKAHPWELDDRLVKPGERMYDNLMKVTAAKMQMENGVESPYDLWVWKNNDEAYYRERQYAKKFKYLKALDLDDEVDENKKPCKVFRITLKAAQDYIKVLEERELFPASSAYEGLRTLLSVPCNSWWEAARYAACYRIAGLKPEWMVTPVTPIVVRPEWFGWDSSGWPVYTDNDVLTHVQQLYGKELVQLAGGYRDEWGQDAWCRAEQRQAASSTWPSNDELAGEDWRAIQLESVKHLLTAPQAEQTILESNKVSKQLSYESHSVY